MVGVNVNRFRIPPQSEADWLRKCAFQLDFFADIDENMVNTGANGAVTPPPPNHSGGLSSTMTNIDRTALESTPQVAPRPTYPQDWTNYSLAQTNEKRLFLNLLRDLCSTVAQPPQGNGRPRMPLADMVFAATYKVYSGFSSRRFTTDIQTAVEDGLIDHAPHFNTTSNYLADPALTPTLKSLIESSAAPLKAVEVDFAIDSTGFSTCHYVRWFDHKWGKERSRKRFIKTHLVTGVKTNIVTTVDAMAYESPDAPQLPGAAG